MKKLNTNLPYYIDSYSIPELINKIEEEKEDVEVSWNSMGGSVYAGQQFADYLNNKENKLNANVTGIAASMGAVLLAFFDNVKGANQSDVMLHSVWGGAASTVAHTNKFLYEALAKKIDEDKFKKITGKELKAVMLAEGEAREDVWLTGKQAKQIGLFDESYDLLKPKANSVELPSAEIGYKIPDHIKNKYNKVENNTKIDMEIKDLKIDDLRSGNPELYNSIVKIGVEQKKAQVNKVAKYAEYDFEKFQELIKNDSDLTPEDVEHFMEKKFNAKKIEDLEEGSSEDIKVAKLTKNEEEKDAAFKAEVEAMREASGVNEILKK